MIKKHNYKGKYLLIGFSCTEKIIELDKNHIIRKGSKEELYEYSKNFENPQVYGGEKFLLDFHFKSTSQFFSTEIFDTMRVLDLFFRLFYDGEVLVPYCERYIQHNPNQDFKKIGFFTDNKISKSRTTKPFRLSKKNVPGFITIWNNLNSINRESNKAFNIALKRHFFSRTKYEQEDRLIDLMIAFEAMFLNDNAELSYRLCLRVSNFLSDYYRKQSCFNFMKISYNLRSKIVHGADIKAKDLKFEENTLNLKEVNENLSEVLIFALRKYIEKYSNYNIHSLIEEIDNQIIQGSLD